MKDPLHAFVEGPGVALLLLNAIPATKSFARKLRNNLTPEERALWQSLSRFRPRFTRQLQIGPFVADFACRRARVIVEIDGSQHIDNAADVHRTKLLEADGWRAVRFWNNEVRDNRGGVMTTIGEAVVGCLPDSETMKCVTSHAGRPRRSQLG